MVGGFPVRRVAAPAPVKAQTVDPEAVEFDEDGRMVVTTPLAPAPRPQPSFARPLPPMPTAPRPGSLPRPLMAPVKPAPRVGPPPPAPKAAPPAPVPKRPPPPPYVRRQPEQYLDPESIPYDPPARYEVRR